MQETRSPTVHESDGGGKNVNFDTWYEHYAEELLRFCRSRLGHTDGEDVFQNVWIKVLGKPEQFVGGNERAWLFSIARTTIIDWIRKKRPDAKTEVVEVLVDAESDTTILEQLVAAENEAIFRSCLAQLPPQKHKLIQLRVTGHSYEQISKALKIAVGTVGSQYNRTCKQLQDCVGRSSNEQLTTT